MALSGFRYGVTNVLSTLRKATPPPAGKPLPAANSLEFLLSAAAPANNCALVTTQAVQAAVVALAQHQHLAAAGAQAAQTSAVAEVQHQHLAAAESQAAQVAALAAAQHQHATIATTQAVQTATAAATQYQNLTLAAQQAAQTTFIASGEPAAANNAALDTTQAPQSSEAIAAHPPAIVWAAGGFARSWTRRGFAPVGVTQTQVQRDLAGVTPVTPAASIGLDGKSYPARRAPKPALVVVNGAVMATLQAAQIAQAEAEMDRNNLVVLYDLIDDDELAFAMLGVAP